ncbi:hypothetical protein FRC01_001388 [Tulasnella sp. 417]|nr:hypothetical protein FRC01_001388 [Tulasnella sp. 417]
MQIEQVLQYPVLPAKHYALVTVSLPHSADIAQAHLSPSSPNKTAQSLIPRGPGSRYHPYAAPDSLSTISDTEIDSSSQSLTGGLEHDQLPTSQLPGPHSQASPYHSWPSLLPKSASLWPVTGLESQPIPPHPSRLQDLPSPLLAIRLKDPALPRPLEYEPTARFPATQTSRPHYHFALSHLPDLALTGPENKSTSRLPAGNPAQESLLQLLGPHAPSSRPHPSLAQRPTFTSPKPHNNGKSQASTQTRGDRLTLQNPPNPGGWGVDSFDHPDVVPAMSNLDVHPRNQSLSPSLHSISGSDLVDPFQMEQGTSWSSQLEARWGECLPPMMPVGPCAQAEQGQRVEIRELVMPGGSLLQLVCPSGDLRLKIQSTCPARQTSSGYPHHSTDYPLHTTCTHNPSMARHTTGKCRPDSTIESDSAGDEPSSWTTRSLKASVTVPKQGTGHPTTRSVPKQPAGRTPSSSKANLASSKAKAAPSRATAKHSKAASKERPRQGPKAKAPNPPGPAHGASKSASSKKVQPHYGDSLNDEDDGDVDMVDMTAPKGRAKGKGSQSLNRIQSRDALKRKSSARNISGTASAVDEPNSDDSASLEAPQAKKTKAANQVQRRAGPRPLPSQSPASTNVNSPTVLPQELSAVSDRPSKTKNGSAQPKSAVAVAQKIVLEKENVNLKALLEAANAEIDRLQNESSQVQQDQVAHNQLIPRPRGERGKNRWNLQANMGLKKDYKLYSNIRRCVRYAVYEAQLNIWKKITEQDERALFTCYTVVKQRFPYMNQFENNWATREFIKGICGNARRHCRRKSITDPTLPAELLEFDDNNDANNGEGENDEGDVGEDGNDGDDDGTGRLSIIQAKVARSSRKSQGNGRRHQVGEDSPRQSDVESNQELRSDDKEFGTDGEDVDGEDVDGEDVDGEVDEDVSYEDDEDGDDEDGDDEDGDDEDVPVGSDSAEDPEND